MSGSLAISNSGITRCRLASRRLSRSSSPTFPKKLMARHWPATTRLTSRNVSRLSKVVSLRLSLRHAAGVQAGRYVLPVPYFLSLCECSGALAVIATITRSLHHLYLSSRSLLASVCLSCLSVYLSVCLSVFCLSVCLFVCLSACMSVFLLCHQILAPSFVLVHCL